MSSPCTKSPTTCRTGAPVSNRVPPRPEIATLLRRLVDCDGRLVRHQIDAETDGENILAAERQHLVEREIREYYGRPSKLISVSITAKGLAAIGASLHPEMDRRGHKLKRTAG